MKKVYIIFTGLLCFYSLSAQVGVNIETPQRLLHINTSNASYTTDDVVVTEKGTVGIGTADPNEALKLQVEGVQFNSLNEGDVSIQGNHYIGGELESPQIGIGTTNPQTMLHIKPGAGEAPLRLADGSEESSYLLTADASGYAFWAALRPMSSIKSESFVSSATVTPPSGGGEGYAVISNKLELTAGKWLIFARSVTTNSAQSLYIYLVLRQYVNATTANPLSRVGAYATTSASGGVAANQLMYLVDISTTTSFDLQLASSTSATFTHAANSRLNYFYAVRLDRN